VAKIKAFDETSEEESSVLGKVKLLVDKVTWQLHIKIF